MLGTVWVQRSRYDQFFHFIMFSAIYESSIGSFRKNDQALINQLSLTTFGSDYSVTFEKYLAKPSYTWNRVGNPRCAKSPVPEFETKTLLEVEKKKNFLFYFVTDGPCSAKPCPHGGSVTPGEKLLTEVTFVFLPASPPLSLKKHRSIKKRRGGGKYCPRVKINGLSQVI